MQASKKSEETASDKDRSDVQEGEMGSSLFVSGPGEHNWLAVLCGFVTGVEKKFVGLIRLYLFHILTMKEMLK